jgi:two-component system OmpR family sensor kinase
MTTGATGTREGASAERPSSWRRVAGPGHGRSPSTLARRARPWVARLLGGRSLTAKMALLFSAIIAIAFCVVYLLVIPQLRSNLEEQALADLERSAILPSQELERVMGSEVPAANLNEVVRQSADQADGRVTLFAIQRSGEAIGRLYPISDSRVAPELSVTQGVATRAARQGEVLAGLGRDGATRVAQAAVPLSTDGREAEWVALYSRSLDNVEEAVGLIQRQVLVAGSVALVVALAGGWLVARAVARRVRRLETAAKDVAQGRSIEPLPIDSEDELGELTRTFNEMQEQLARMDRSRREFIANASHELRTPIFSLGGFAELLQDEDLDPDTRERFLESMRGQIDRLKKLASDLLDLSRLDAGALHIHWRDADLAEIADSVLTEFAPGLAERDAQLEVNLPADGVGAHCDPDRVAQIVRILLDNALSHNPDGTRIEVSASRRGDLALLSVADHGEGLGSAAVERVFERFYTADAARGSGLGLAIARELAERMHGDIAVRSRPGRTQFTLSLAAAGEALGTERSTSLAGAPHPELSRS